MKAIVLHQPYAALVALGVKLWETRPSPPNGPMRPEGVRGLPGLSVAPGERIAIVAGKRKPGDGIVVGGWQVESWRDETAERCLVHVDDPSGRRRVWPLPLGVVVCTAVVAEALPIVPLLIPAGLTCTLRSAPIWNGRHRVFAGDDRPLLHTRDSGPLADISDQTPYGDWQPGRWAWRLSDVEPCNPWPVTGRQGVFEIGDM